MSRSRAAASALAIALVACNGVLGLERTERDSDRDGIPDDLDNCPNVFNPDQINSDRTGAGDACTVCSTPVHVDLDGDGFDDGCDLCLGPGPIGVDADGDGVDDGCDPCVAGVSAFPVDANHDGIEDGCEWCLGGGVGIDIDHDGLDDACDHCLNGPPHDEDGDGIEDGCDNCPALPNPQQEIAIAGDLRGTACTLDNAPFLALFEPFLADRPRIWSGPLPAGWTIAHDQLVIDAPATSADRLTNLIDPSSFVAIARVRFTAPTAQSLVGFVATADGVSTLRCELGATGRLQISLVTVGLPTQTATATGIDATGDVTLVLSAFPAGGPIASHATCTATSADGVAHTTSPVPIPDPTSGWHPGITASFTGATFDFLEIAASVTNGHV